MKSIGKENEIQESLCAGMSGARQGTDMICCSRLFIMFVAIATKTQLPTSVLVVSAVMWQPFDKHVSHGLSQYKPQISRSKLPVKFCERETIFNHKYTQSINYVTIKVT